MPQQALPLDFVLCFTPSVTEVIFFMGNYLFSSKPSRLFFSSFEKFLRFMSQTYLRGAFQQNPFVYPHLEDWPEHLSDSKFRISTSYEEDDLNFLEKP